MVFNGIFTAYSLHLSPCGQKKGDGVEFYRLRVTLCKEASGDTVGDEYGLFKGPQGWTLSLIPQLPVGLLSPLPPLGDFRSHRQRQSQEAI